ncbi:GNAT family N-acetyltransferase [Alicyclobacillus tolerans]|uniref:RimJ/RimL family protein N-acetyltransferase n=1 Tax=Alicyclobacillus tolerans TaxID=90970 RepID=A0ABT9LX46_9BACL|nr:GNAT family N-acetyltransferase [Alicyclobacillus tengchongensis]MDP9728818.1 RimJ/RimL family protein N-acetyltransferase [Alicyclobacillus tengchongensis]
MGNLEDGDLRLRPLDIESDVPFALDWYQDPDVLRNSEGEGTEPYNQETVERMYRYLSEHGELYIIEVQESGVWKPIGDVALCPDMVPIVIGNILYRGLGLGRRVIQMLIDRATALGWERLVVSKVYSYNRRSLRMFESVGFRRVAEFQDDKGRTCVKMELKLGQKEGCRCEQ